jgi:hypothetical protein
MAEPTLDSIGAWILANQDKKGTPDYVNMSEAYRQLSKGGATTAPAGEPNPYSAGNTAGRVGTDAVLGIPDLLIAANNAGILNFPQAMLEKGAGAIARGIGYNMPEPQRPQIPQLAPMARQAIGVEELPEDAPWYRRLGESGASAAVSPTGVGIVKTLAKEGATAGAKMLGKTIVAPTIGSDVGARVGGAVGGEPGAIIGGVIGGGASQHARPLGENWVQGRYTGQGKPNAPEVAAAAGRLGIEPTAGALGNYDIQKRENAYAAQPTILDRILNRPTLAASEQQRIRSDMTAAGEDIGVQRGGTGAGPAAIGEDIRGAAADRLQADRDYSSAGQENLQRDIGDRTPVRVIDIINEARQAWPHLSVPGRQSLEARIVGQLYPLISQRDAHGNPVIGPNTTVPYELVKQWRTELGRSFDQGNVPRNRELYEPATRAMAETATRAGVPPGRFGEVQSFTRGVEGEGGLAERLAPFDKEGGQAHDYVLGDAGLRRPERVQTFADETAGDPRQGDIFGSHIQQRVADTLGSGQAQGPNKFASFIEDTDPRALATIGGPQTGRLQDLGTLARAVDVPTSQRGLGTSVAGVAAPLANTVLGSTVLGKLGAAIDPILAPVGHGLGWMAQPVLNHINQRIMQSDAAKRGLLGAPVPLSHRMTIQDLLHTLNVIGQNQPPPQQQEP